MNRPGFDACSHFSIVFCFFSFFFLLFVFVHLLFLRLGLLIISITNRKTTKTIKIINRIIVRMCWLNVCYKSRKEKSFCLFDDRIKAIIRFSILSLEIRIGKWMWISLVGDVFDTVICRSIYFAWKLVICYLVSMVHHKNITFLLLLLIINDRINT